MQGGSIFKNKGDVHSHVNRRTHREFLLPWESTDTRSYFLEHKDKIGERLSAHDLFNIELGENHEARRKRKWKELRSFWTVLENEQSYKRKGSIENALWFYGHKGITVNHFVMAIMNEFEFDMKLNVDNNLRWLYWSFENGARDSADWRDILCAFRIILLYKYVKDRPCELLVKMFDLYADGGDKPNSQPNASWFIPEASDYLQRIFRAPCENDIEIKIIDDLLEKALLLNFNTPATVSIGRGKDNTIYDEGIPSSRLYRREFRALLRKSDTLVSTWRSFAWNRLPKVLRLQAYDVAQSEAQERVDAVLSRFKMKQAILINEKSLYRASIVQWKIVALSASKVRKFTMHQLRKKYVRFFRFWRILTSKKRTKVRRILLAEVIGSYAIKARMFARIKLHNWMNRRLLSLGIQVYKGSKEFGLGVAHMRRHWRLRLMRHFYHQWWNRAVEIINQDMVIRHDFVRRMLPIMKKWQYWAHWEHKTRRMELVAIENQIHFEKMFKEVDVAVEEIIKAEATKKKRQEDAEMEKKIAEKEQRLESSKKLAKERKQDDVKILLKVQREARRKRVKKEMKTLKKKFTDKWVRKKAELIETARIGMLAFVNSPDNKLAMQMKFEKLKREFYAPPSVDNRAREEIIANPKNIVILYLANLLKQRKLTLKRVLQKFDVGHKGHLTYEEFAKLVRSLGKFNAVQINDAIRGVDSKNGGFINFKEVEDSLEVTKKMGVIGSPWKLYVDPIQDVICYHNFDTDEKIFEYQMTDEKLKDISTTDEVFSAMNNAETMADAKRIEEWDLLIKNHMARRIQRGMYRVWKARKKRQKKIWRIKSRDETLMRSRQIYCVNYFVDWFQGYKSRVKFIRELMLTYEKVWDVSSRKLFWYNHLLKSSHWERPHLLWRYGDVSKPHDWIAKDVTLPNGTVTVHYWHVPSGKDVPRKPDGYRICQQCFRELALHTCLQCKVNYCFRCHRQTHSSVLNFRQKDRPTRKQLLDPVFYAKTLNIDHKWQMTQTIPCDQCKSTKMLAAFHCNECNKDLCRPCTRKMHDHGSMHDHMLTEVL